MILTEVFPNMIPKEFVHNFSITLEEESEVIEIPKKMLPETIDIQNPVGILRSINIKNAKVEIIEIILNLEKIKSFVVEGTENILSNIFDEDS